MRFLVVERFPSRAEQICGALARFGAEIIQASEVGEARVLVAARGRIDVAVLSEPGVAGEEFELVEWLRARGADVPIVFIGGDSHIEHAVRAIRSGARSYVVRREGYLARLTEDVAGIVRGLERCMATTRSQFEEAERLRLGAVLARHHWNVSAAARALGISRSRLRSRLAALDMDR